MRLKNGLLLSDYDVERNWIWPFAEPRRYKVKRLAFCLPSTALASLFGVGMLRAVGPSLAQQGVGNALADPFIELHDSPGTIIAVPCVLRETAEVSERLP